MLKAVLASRRVDYPKTHNLRVLIELLANDGVQLPEGLVEITRLTQFGTTFRYDTFLPAAGDERAKWLDWIGYDQQYNLLIQEGWHQDFSW